MIKSPQCKATTPRINRGIPSLTVEGKLLTFSIAGSFIKRCTTIDSSNGSYTMSYTFRFSDLKLKTNYRSITDGESADDCNSSPKSIESLDGSFHSVLSVLSEERKFNKNTHETKIHNKCCCNESCFRHDFFRQLKLEHQPYFSRSSQDISDSCAFDNRIMRSFSLDSMHRSGIELNSKVKVSSLAVKSPKFTSRIGILSPVCRSKKVCENLMNYNEDNSDSADNQCKQGTETTDLQDEHYISSDLSSGDSIASETHVGMPEVPEPERFDEEVSRLIGTRSIFNGANTRKIRNVDIFFSY